MSHITEIAVAFTDLDALKSACRRLKLPAPEHKTAKLFSGAEATGHCVQLPGWKYLAVFDLTTGSAKFDNFAGHWGDVKELKKLRQAYSAELSIAKMRSKGYHCRESVQQDGSLKLQFRKG